MKVAPIPLLFDVTDRVALGEPCQISASLFLPEVLPARPTVVVAVPGGTYTRAYWHLEVPGRGGYSFAAHLVGAGLAVVALDNLGTGASTRPRDADQVTFETAAAANAEVAAELADRIGSGRLAAGVPARADVRLVGVGHSLGGQLLAVQQAAHRSYERVAVLGSSFLGDDADGATARLSAMSPETWDGGYLDIPRSHLRPLFHAPDVPDDVLAADDAGATVLPRRLGVGALAPAPYQQLLPDIDVPVLLAYADVDTSPDPLAELAMYRRSPDVTLVRLAGSAHCHNSSGARLRLWDRLVRWISVPERSPAGAPYAP